MKKLLAILLFFTVTSYAQLHKMSADTEFLYTYGGTNFDEARDIKETYDKGYIIAGTTSSFGEGSTSIYLIKTDSLGNHQWSKTQGGTDVDKAYTMQLTSDSGFFVAGFSSSFNPNNSYNAYYLKTDRNGNLLWQKTIYDTDNWSFIYGSTALPDSGFLMCGKTYANSYGGSDAYLVRVNKNGDTLWTNHYGGLQDETFNSVCIINNRIYAVGSNATHPADTAADGWITKLDINGALLADTFIYFASHNQEIFNGITAYNSSQFHVCGQNISDSTTNGMNGKMDTLFNQLIYPITNFAPNGRGEVEIFNKVINTSFGSTCLIGTKTGGNGGLGMFLTGYDRNENNINDFYPTIGGSKDENGYGGIYTSTGKVIVVGSSQSTSDYCPTTSNMGIEDAFLVRYNSDSIHTQNVYPLYSCNADSLPLWASGIQNYYVDIKTTLFPNPVNENTVLRIIGNYEGKITAKIYSLLSTEVMQLEVYPNKDNVINCSSLPNGAYFLKTQNEFGSIISTTKIIISH